MHTSLTTPNSVQLIYFDHPAAKGHCKCLKIQPPGSEALAIWGVYVPCTGMHTRKEVYNLLQIESQTQQKIALEAGTSKPCHILTGDINAATQTSVHPEDTMHQELMQILKMHRTDKHQGTPRSQSYHRHGRNCKSSGDSRIDVLLENTYRHHGRYYRKLRPQPNTCHHPTDIHELHQIRTYIVHWAHTQKRMMHLT